MFFPHLFKIQNHNHHKISSPCGGWARDRSLPKSLGNHWAGCRSIHMGCLTNMFLLISLLGLFCFPGLPCARQCPGSHRYRAEPCSACIRSERFSSGKPGWQNPGMKLSHLDRVNWIKNDKYNSISPGILSCSSIADLPVELLRKVLGPGLKSICGRQNFMRPGLNVPHVWRVTGLVRISPFFGNFSSLFGFLGTSTQQEIIHYELKYHNLFSMISWCSFAAKGPTLYPLSHWRSVAWMSVGNKSKFLHQR